MRWKSIIGVALLCLALLSSTVFMSLDLLALNWEPPQQRLIAAAWLELPALCGGLLVLVDYVQQRRQGDRPLWQTVGGALFSVFVGMAIVGQHVALYLLQPAQPMQILLGRPLPQGTAPQGESRWERHARLEHEAIGAFLHLARDLATSGAPQDLVERCLRAADEESDHAVQSAAIAGVELPPLPRLRRPTPTRWMLAWESVRDGVIGEGRAVAVAKHQLRDTQSPAERTLLLQIVEEEASHAYLSGDIAAWALLGTPGCPRACPEADERLRLLEATPQPDLEHLCSVG